MDRRSHNTLSYQRPLETGSAIEIEQFADGGVTVHIPRDKPGLSQLIGIAAVVAIVVFGVAFLFIRVPALILMSAIAVMMTGAVTATWLKFGNIAPDVIGFSCASMYFATSEPFVRREIEAPLASIKEIRVAPRDDQKGALPGSIEISLAGRANVVVCSGCSPKEITRICQALKQSWEALTAAEDAPVRDALDAFLLCCAKCPAADDRTIVSKLVANGMDQALAAKLTLIVPIAFVRSIHKDHATFHPYCLVVDDRAKPLRRLRLEDERVFNLAVELSKRLAPQPADADLVRRISERSPEATAIEKRMRSRNQHGLIALAPPRIPQFRSLY